MSELPDEAIELAHRLFDLAREGRADALGPYLAGAPLDMRDPSGNTILEHGADPDAGQPTARATAEMFGRSDLL